MLPEPGVCSPHMKRHHRSLFQWQWLACKIPLHTELDGSRARYTFFYQLVYIGQYSVIWGSGDCNIMLWMMLYYSYSNILCYITNAIRNIMCVKFGKLIWIYKLIIWHLLASVHQPTQSWQVQFIDACHQNAKLHKIYFWIKMTHFCMDLIAISVTP